MATRTSPGYRTATRLLAGGLLLLGLTSPVAAELTLPCTGIVRERAARLLDWHTRLDRDPTTAIEIEPNVTEQHSLANPAQPEQRLRVFEIWGSVYKARYRMRFLFAPPPATCALVGEEILEFGAF